MRCLKKIQILTPKAKSVCAFNFGVAPDAAASPAVFSAPGDDEVREHWRENTLGSMAGLRGSLNAP